MSQLISRLRATLALVVTLVVCATVLTPVAADAQDDRTLTVQVTANGSGSAGHNELISWNVDVTCQAEVGECGNAIIESQLSAGVIVSTVDTTLAPGYVLVSPADATTGSGQPTILQLQRAADLLDGETVSFVMHGKVGPDAHAGATLDHLVLVGSTNTPTVSATAAPIVVANTADWQLQGFATGEATLGRNETHRVAVCGTTEANVAHGDLVVDLALPAATVVVDAAEAEETPTGLRWSIPAISPVELANEHEADLAAGRSPELCHEFFPSIRWAAPDHVLGEAVPVTLSLSGPAGESVDMLCPVGCRLDASLVLVASTTVIEARVTGPDAINAGGIAEWDVELDASATVEDVQVPLLDINLPDGLQLERLDVTDLPDGVEAHIHGSVDGGASYAPDPIRTTDTDRALLNRDDFDSSVGMGTAIDALQIRLVSLAGEPVLAAGAQPRITLMTSPDPVQPPTGVAELCAQATSANAASIDGRACFAAAVEDAGAVFGIASSVTSPAPPTDDQLVTTTLRVPTTNGAPIIDPVIGALLPEGFDFRGLDTIVASEWAGDLPRPLVEATQDYNGTGRTLVLFRWSDVDDVAAAHTLMWTPAEMRAAAAFVPLDVALIWRIAAPAGHTPGADVIDLAVTSLILPPSQCPGESTMRDDLLGLGTAMVCGLEAMTETSSGSSLVQDSRVAGESLLPFVSVDPVQTWCEITRVDDVDWTAAPCAAPSTPNGRVQFQSDVTNTGNRDLTDLWSYGLLPRIGDVGIDPATWETPRDSAWAASLAGPVVVSGAWWDPVEPGDVLIEYSSATDPCRSALNVTQAVWPPGCLDDWTASPDNWSDVTAWRVHVPFERTPFIGGASLRIEGELLVAADADFDTAAFAEVMHTALDEFDNTLVDTGTAEIAVVVPREDEILAADPSLLPHDLALIATVNAEDSSALHDGVASGEAFIVDIQLLNQGAPVDAIDVALHLDAAILADAASGSTVTADARSISWTLTPGSPAILAVQGTFGRADEVRIPVPLRVAPAWSGEETTEQPLGLVAEISRFDANGAAGTLIDHDSIPDLDPLNDVGPDRPGVDGDDVVTGDGEPDTGVEPDPIADDEDDHDVAGIPIWDVATKVTLAEGQAPVLDWAAPTVEWVVEVVNEGDRDAFDLTVDQRLPDGMTWMVASETVASDVGVDLTDPTSAVPVITADDAGQVTIDVLEPGASAVWKARAQATDPSVHDFTFEVELLSFADDPDPETEPSALVRDLDGDDLVGSASAALPWDIAVGLEHRSTTGLPFTLDSGVDVDLVIENVGRSVAVAVVDLALNDAGLRIDSPDPSLSVTDDLGRPVRVTWDLTDPVRPRIQVQPSDGTSFGHGARVVVPVGLSVSDLSIDPTAMQIAAMLSGFDASPALAIELERVDTDPANDRDDLIIPIWDLALTIAEPTPVLRATEDDVVAEWGIRVENQGNRDATDIVIEVDLGDRMTNETGALVVPFLAAGQHADLVVVSSFIDGFDGTFAVGAQIMSLADANREARFDVDSRPGQLAANGSVEDDEAHVERELPVSVELAIEHVSTSVLPIVPGESTATFDVVVRNVGRPLHDIELVLDAGDFGPVILDVADAPYRLTAGEQPGAVVLTLPEDAPLMPDGFVTLSATLRIPQGWDGAVPHLGVTTEAVTPEGESATVIAPMAIWDLALDVVADAQSERLGQTGPAQWELSVVNQGNRDAHDVVIAVTVPDGMVWQGLVGAGVSTQAAAGDDGEIEVTVDKIEAGATAIITLRTELVATDRSLFRLGAELVTFDTDAETANDTDPRAGDIDSTPRAFAESTTGDIDGVDAAASSVPEDDQDFADAALPADVAVSIALDPTTAPRAGAASNLTISVTNQGLDLADASLVLALDERWQLPDLATLPAATSGGGALAVAWDLTDPVAPRAQLSGAWPSGTTLDLVFELVTADDASGNGTPLRAAASIVAVDDDGFPATPAPELDDIDGDASAILDVDVFDLALTVRIDPSASLPPAAESEVTFIVDVINQGTIAATDATIALHPASDQWMPLANTAVSVVDAAAALAPGETKSVPVVLTLAAEADLTAASLVVEIQSASGVDFDSVPDTDPANDVAPLAPGDPTDGVVDNRQGDEDDHDVVDLEPPSWVLGNQVWFDANTDGLRDDDELPAAGVLVELLLDANADGIPDDRDLSGSVDAADRLATATTDAQGLFRFDDVAAGSYLVAIPPSEFADGGPLAGWSATITPADGPADGANDATIRSDGGITSATITVAGAAPLGEMPNNATDLADDRTDLTIDFGLGQWSLGNQVWFDTIENGRYEAAEEEGVPEARLYLFVDTNGDGLADDVNADGKLSAVDAIATTTADVQGRYQFDGLGAGTYIVAVADVTMNGPLRGWAISPFSRAADDPRDDDSNAAGWSGQHVLSSPMQLGGGSNIDLTLDFGFELAEVEKIVWPDVDLTGFTGPQSFSGGNGGTTSFAGNEGPTFFGPAPAEDLGGFESFGDIDLFEGDESFGDVESEELGESFDFVGEEFFDDPPEGPLAYTGNNSRTLVSWAAMLIVFGAVLVGVSRETDQG